MIPGSIRHEKLTTVIGPLFIYEDATIDLPKLFSVSDWVSVGHSSTVHAPTLAQVGGELTVLSHAVLTAEALAEVGGKLTVYPGGRLDAPLLTRVGGEVVACPHSTLNVPSLSEIGGRLEVRNLGVLRGRYGVVARPGDSAERYRRRWLSHLITEPHGTCDRVGRCIEHEVDPSVEACR